MRARPRIVHLITDLRRGGEARLLLAYLPQLERARFENIVCCLAPLFGARSSTESHLLREFEAAGIKVVNLRAAKSTILLSMARLFWLLLREKPDILHTYLFHPNVIGRVVGRLAGVPIVVSSVVSVDAWKRRHHVVLERMTARLVDRILINAAAVGDRLVARDGVPRSRLRLIYNGVDVERFQKARAVLRRERGLGESVPIIGTVCRLHRAKGLDHLLRAFACVAPRGNAVLVVVGDGPERPALEELAGDLRIAGRVHWLGVRDDVPALLRDFDLFVVSSVWEGLPGTVFEAMAAGVPIVATRVGGIPEVLQHLVNAVLVEPGRERELIDAAWSLLENRRLAHRLANRATSDVREKFTFEQATRERLDWYGELLAAEKGVSDPRRRAPV